MHSYVCVYLHGSVDPVLLFTSSCGKGVRNNITGHAPFSFRNSEYDVLVPLIYRRNAMLHTVRYEVAQQKVQSFERLSSFCLALGWEFMIFAESYHIYVAETPGCFVATASTGHESSYEVVTLTKYRDEVLRHHFLGRMFIKTYEFTAPPIARWLKRGIRRRLFVKNYIVSPIARMVSRWI